MTEHVARAEVTIDAPAATVWRGLTDPETISRYMAGSRVETNWTVGSPITWNGEYDGKPYQDKGQVLEFDPTQRLVVTHYSPMMGQEDVPENYHRISYDLAERGGRTAVRLEQDGNDSAEQAEQFSNNWQQMLDGLKTEVEGGGSPA
jgi:uncharacterized protein YndB with AHSA1/START domain